MMAYIILALVGLALILNMVRYIWLNVDWWAGLMYGLAFVPLYIIFAVIQFRNLYLEKEEK